MQSMTLKRNDVFCVLEMRYVHVNHASRHQSQVLGFEKKTNKNPETILTRMKPQF